MYSVSDCYLECKAIVFMYVVSVREKLLHTISLNATMNNVREKERRRSVYKKMYRKYTEERETKKKEKKTNEKNTSVSRVTINTYRMFSTVHSGNGPKRVSIPSLYMIQASKILFMKISNIISRELRMYTAAVHLPRSLTR